MLSKVRESKKLKKTTQHAEGTITPNKQMQLPFFKTSITKCQVSYISLYFFLLFLFIDYKLIIYISIVNIMNL